MRRLQDVFSRRRLADLPSVVVDLMVAAAAKQAQIVDIGGSPGGLSNRLCEGMGSWVFSGLGLVG